MHTEGYYRSEPLMRDMIAAAVGNVLHEITAGVADRRALEL